MSAAVSLLRLPVSNEPYGERTPFMAYRTYRSQVKAEEWPAVKEGAVAKSVPRSRGWTKRNMSVASGSGARGSADGEQKLDVSDMKSPNVGGSEGKFGNDQKVNKGLAGQWRALENARFVPKQGDRRHLMNIINTMAKTDIGAA